MRGGVCNHAGPRNRPCASRGELRVRKLSGLRRVAGESGRYGKGNNPGRSLQFSRSPAVRRRWFGAKRSVRGDEQAPAERPQMQRERKIVCARTTGERGGTKLAVLTEGVLKPEACRDAPKNRTGPALFVRKAVDEARPVCDSVTGRAAKSTTMTSRQLSQCATWLDSCASWAASVRPKP